LSLLLLHQFGAVIFPDMKMDGIIPGEKFFILGPLFLAAWPPSAAIYIF